MIKSRYNSISEINLTNLVDITMVLLIIFMITAPFIFSGIKVDLPKTRAENLPVHQNVVVSMTSEGFIYINEEKVDGKNFQTVLMQKYREADRRGVLLKADRQIAYGDVIALMGQIKQAGIANLGLVVQSEPEQ
jgi:biopolymer transport protein TolR